MRRSLSYLFRSMRATTLAAAAIVSGTVLLPAHAADSYLNGNISNITSTTSGLLIMLDSGVPTNCTGTPYGWMIIPEANKTMVAVTLLAWHTNNRAVTVYTNAMQAGGWCYINQVDPVN